MSTTSKAYLLSVRPLLGIAYFSLVDRVLNEYFRTGCLALNPSSIIY